MSARRPMTDPSDPIATPKERVIRHRRYASGPFMQAGRAAMHDCRKLGPHASPPSGRPLGPTRGQTIFCAADFGKRNFAICDLLRGHRTGHEEGSDALGQPALRRGFVKRHRRNQRPVPEATRAVLRPVHGPRHVRVPSHRRGQISPLTASPEAILGPRRGDHDLLPTDLKASSE